MTVANRGAKRDLWIPAGFVLFFVGLAILQGAFVFVAQTTFRGLVTDQTMKGPQAGPAWSAEVAFIGTSPLAGHATLVLKDATGAPLSPDRIDATIERGSKFPQSLPLAFAAVAPGRWRAAVDVPMAGPWTIRVTATRGVESFEAIAIVEVAP